MKITKRLSLILVAVLMLSTICALSSCKKADYEELFYNAPASSPVTNSDSILFNTQSTKFAGSAALTLTQAGKDQKISFDISGTADEKKNSSLKLNGVIPGADENIEAETITADGKVFVKNSAFPKKDWYLMADASSLPGVDIPDLDKVSFDAFKTLDEARKEFFDILRPELKKIALVQSNTEVKCRTASVKGTSVKIVINEENIKSVGLAVIEKLYNAEKVKAAAKIFEADEDDYKDFLDELKEVFSNKDPDKAIEEVAPESAELERVFDGEIPVRELLTVNFAGKRKLVFDYICIVDGKKAEASARFAAETENKDDDFTKFSLTADYTKDKNNYLFSAKVESDDDSYTAEFEVKDGKINASVKDDDKEIFGIKGKMIINDEGFDADVVLAVAAAPSVKIEIPVKAKVLAGKDKAQIEFKISVDIPGLEKMQANAEFKFDIEKSKVDEIKAPEKYENFDPQDSQF